MLWWGEHALVDHTQGIQRSCFELYRCHLIRLISDVPPQTLNPPDMIFFSQNVGYD